MEKTECGPYDMFSEEMIKEAAPVWIGTGIFAAFIIGSLAILQKMEDLGIEMPFVGS